MTTYAETPLTGIELGTVLLPDAGADPGDPGTWKPWRSWDRMADSQDRLS
jgi:hypothetical protein